MANDFVGIEPLGRADRAFELHDADDDRTRFAAEAGRVRPDVAQALDDDALAVESRREAQGFHVVGDTARLA